jgi:hypothetical protein
MWQTMEKEKTLSKFRLIMCLNRLQSEMDIQARH